MTNGKMVTESHHLNSLYDNSIYGQTRRATTLGTISFDCFYSTLIILPP